MAAEEVFDLVDEFAQVTGKTATKTEIHAKALRHRGTHVWLYNDQGQVLLQFRDKAKVICPERWDVSVAGHCWAGEEPLQTAIREAKEEINLTLKPEDLEFIGITPAMPGIMPGGAQHKVFDWNYLVRTDLDIAQLKLQQHETAAVAWKHIDDLEREVLAPDYLVHYSYRDRYLYLMATAEIRKRLQGEGTVS